VHAAGAVEPAAAAGAGPRSTTRSEIAGVVTTEGPDGTGLSMTRVVQAVSAAPETTNNAIVALIGFPP
jgi:hypothetical protein